MANDNNLPIILVSSAVVEFFQGGPAKASPGDNASSALLHNFEPEIHRVHTSWFPFQYCVVSATFVRGPARLEYEAVWFVGQHLFEFVLRQLVGVRYVPELFLPHRERLLGLVYFTLNYVIVPRCHQFFFDAQQPCSKVYFAHFIALKPYYIVNEVSWKFLSVDFVNHHFSV